MCVYRYVCVCVYAILNPKLRAFTALPGDLGLTLAPTGWVTQRSPPRGLTSGLCGHLAHMWYTEIHV